MERFNYQEMSEPSGQIGNFRRCLKINNRYLLHISPQWYMLIIISFFVLGFGLILMIFFLSKMMWVVQVIYVLVFLLMVCITLGLGLKNPGIIEPSTFISDVENNNPNKFCDYCKIVRPKHTEHCHDCNVCIRDYDHHCDVLGICVGGGNICFFYAYVCTIPFYFTGSILLLASMVN